MIKILHILLEPLLAVYLPKNAGAQKKKKTQPIWASQKCDFYMTWHRHTIQLICSDKVTNGLTPVFQMKYWLLGNSSYELVSVLNQQQKTMFNKTSCPDKMY